MELPAGINRRYASFATFLLLAIWCWVALDRPYIFPDHIPWNIYSNSPQSNPSTDIFDYPPLASSAIKKVCANTQFNENILFTCDDSLGNVADVANSILHCVRYAIAAGGSLMLPKIAIDPGDGREIVRGELPSMFDTKHFVASLGLSCPQLRVYTSIQDTPGRFDANVPIPLDPESLVTKDKDGQMRTEEWRPSFDKWLAQYNSLDIASPVVIQLARTYLQYPISSDGPDFVNHFGRILKIREGARVLATTTLIKMAAAYNFGMSIKEPVIHKSFLGAYLSTREQGNPSKDPERVTARFDAQLKLYLQQAAMSNLTTIYLASDDNSYLGKFREAANSTTITITTKLELLKGKDREDLIPLSPDEQALIDFLVFSKSSDFAGIGYSSFAWNVALKRRQYSEQEDNWLNTEDGLLSDELSQIYGPAGTHPEFIASMWP